MRRNEGKTRRKGRRSVDVEKCVTSSSASSDICSRDDPNVRLLSKEKNSAASEKA